MENYEKAVEEVKDEQGCIEYIWTVEDYEAVRLLKAFEESKRSTSA